MTLTKKGEGRLEKARRSRKCMLVVSGREGVKVRVLSGLLKDRSSFFSLIIKVQHISQRKTNRTKQLKIKCKYDE